ncbi:hypothetical protein [Spirosoma linguale]|uniref:hypothetical protein n=1 Tax=Spirosoma linguale TaxID=108 RepID=UPI00269141F4
MKSTSMESGAAANDADQFTKTGSKAKRLTFDRGCPSCGRSYALERVPRNFLFKYVLRFIPTRAFHCYYCQHSFIRIG